MNSSDLSRPLDQQVCDKFLRVASLIFCWNFSPKYLYLHFKILISAFRSNNFRPPESWNDVFRDTSIVTFFMQVPPPPSNHLPQLCLTLQLHSRVRYNELLCQNSMVCLAQLASLMGDALGSSGQIVFVLPQIGDLNERRLATSMSGSELEKGGDSKNVLAMLLHDQYVQVFTKHLIDIFSEWVTNIVYLKINVSLAVAFWTTRWPRSVPSFTSCSLAIPSEFSSVSPTRCCANSSTLWSPAF
jgi:hypothetical protein